jgi:hypothetical protein
MRQSSQSARRQEGRRQRRRTGGQAEQRWILGVLSRCFPCLCESVTTCVLLAAAGWLRRWLIAVLAPQRAGGSSKRAPHGNGHTTGDGKRETTDTRTGHKEREIGCLSFGIRMVH